MKEIVRVFGLTKDYPLGEVTVHALRGVDFSIYDGEMVVILGPSGSGKSTTMNLLGGIETATSGEIWYCGEKLQWNDKRKLTEYRRNHFPNRLSGGEQQRVAIARALCKNPDLLLCDEPTGALDSRTGVQVLSLICDFCREYRKPVVMVTHNRTIAEMADRVFYFKDGIIERTEEVAHPKRPEEIVW